MSQRLLLLPRSAVVRIEGGGRHGQCVVAAESDFGLGAVVSLSVEGSDGLLPSPLPRGHPLGTASQKLQGYWRRADPSVSWFWLATAARGAVLSVSQLREHVDFGLNSAGNGSYYLVTYAPEVEDLGGSVGVDPPPAFTAWLISDGAAHPVSMDVERAEEGPLSLEPRWPAAVLADAHVAVVGVGSIGSAACHSLARFGVGTISLVDPDRLQWHNLVRHMLEPKHVGALKVNGVAEQLQHRWPQMTVHSYDFDAVHDADLLVRNLSRRLRPAGVTRLRSLPPVVDLRCWRWAG